MRRHRRLAGVIAVLAVAVPMAGCSQAPDGGDRIDGALAAAQVYADALADRDVEQLDAMTDPAALDTYQEADDVDIRPALADAVDPITDPWVSLASATTGTYTVQISYRIKELTGGGLVQLTLQGGEDPARTDSWQVTQPLIERTGVNADQQHVSAGRIGSVQLSFSGSSVSLWGYPGGYEVAPERGVKGVEPLWIAVGAADVAPWYWPYPQLEKRTD